MSDEPLAQLNTVGLSLSLRDNMLRMVLLGMKKEKESKSLKVETESCSICFENFSGSNPTRMTCSHVFHGPCLVQWLYRKNSCPLCRTELYDR